MVCFRGGIVFVLEVRIVSRLHLDIALPISGLFLWFPAAALGSLLPLSSENRSTELPGRTSDEQGRQPTGSCGICFGNPISTAGLDWQGVCVVGLFDAAWRRSNTIQRKGKE